MLDKILAELARQKWNPHSGLVLAEYRVVLKEFFFGTQGLDHAQTLVRFVLRPAFHTYVAKNQRVDFAFEDLMHRLAIFNPVHFCDHPKSSLSLWVDLSGQFQGIAVCDIVISRADRQNQRVRILDIESDHFFDLGLDVLRLVSHRNFRNSWEIDQT